MDLGLLPLHIFYLFLQVVRFQDISTSKFYISLFFLHPKYTCETLEPPVFIVLMKKLQSPITNRHPLRYAVLHWSHTSSFLCLISLRHIQTGNSVV